MNSNLTDDSNRQAVAYAYYHAHYNNTTYKAVQVALVSDLCGAYQASEPKLLDIALGTEPAHKLMNLLTDVCLELAGHPDFQEQCERLVRALVDAEVNDLVVRLMSEHMENFEEMGSTFSADFENTALVLLRLQRLDLHRLKAHSSVIHSIAGNVANDLVSAADYLFQVAKLVLLAEPSQDYLNEKLHSAERYLSYAKEELHKPQPAPIIPHKTLLLSEDKTYPGLVVSCDEHGAQVTWYKWGYASSDRIQNWLTFKQVQQLVVSPEECIKRFDGLPPNYEKQ